MSDRDSLLQQIKDKAVVHGKVTLSSGREADYYVDLRRVTLDSEAAPLVGAGHLPPLEFLRWNVVGGVLWGTGVTLLGYYLGNVSFIGRNLELFAILIVGISVLPIAVELLRARSRR